MRHQYEVFYLDEHDSQKTGGRFISFIEAQVARDDLISQGYGAWIEEIAPAYSGATP